MCGKGGTKLDTYLLQSLGYREARTAWKVSVTCIGGTAFSHAGPTSADDNDGKSSVLWNVACSVAHWNAVKDRE